MKLIKILTLFTITFSTYATSYVVMSSTTSSVDERVSISELREIYLGKKTFWENGERVFAAHIDKNSKPMEVFLKEALSMVPRQFNNYWRRRLFSGKGHPPTEFESDTKTLEYVSKTDGAIGIISNLPSKRNDGLYYFKPKNGELNLVN